MIEKQLFEHLDEFFDEYGYELVPHRKQWRSDDDIGCSNIILSVSGNNPAIIEVNLGVRIHRVEETLARFTNGIKNFSEDSNTLVTSIGRIQGEPFHHYEAATKQDVINVARQITSFMEEEGIDFLDNLMDITVLDELFNSEPEEKVPYIYNDIHRCFRGLILAQFNNNPHFFLIWTVYREYLEKRNAPESVQQRFEELYRYLHTFSMN